MKRTQLLSLTALSISFAFGAYASSTPTLSQKPSLAAPEPPALNIKADAWVLMSYQSGQVIAGQNIYQHVPPASLTKLMTSYVVSQALEGGKIKLDSPVHISTKAWKTGGSKMFIREGTTVSVEDLMKGMIIQSGNDATVALAEYLGGSPEAFAGMMNHAAKGLGMNNSHFMNASGLPAQDQYTSAYDIALLSRALIAHFPKEYSWYKQKSFTFNGIKQYNRNKLLWENTHVDGLKTGYTQAAKYCLAASGLYNGQRYIAVVMGAESPASRTQEADKLLSYAGRFFETKQLFAAHQILESLPIAGTAGQALKVTIKKPVYITIPKGHDQKIKAHMAVTPNLKAPIKAGSSVGQLVVNYGDDVLETQPLYADNTVEPAGFFKRATHKVKGWF